MELLETLKKKRREELLKIIQEKHCGLGLCDTMFHKTIMPFLDKIYSETAEAVAREMTLKHYLESIFNKVDKTSKIEIENPLAYNMFKNIESLVMEEMEKENPFRDDHWFHKNRPMIRELMRINTVVTIKVIHYLEERINLSSLKE